MNIFFIILSVFLVLISLSIFISVQIKFNIFENYGYIKVKLFGFIIIFYSEIKIEPNYINLLSKHKTIKIKLDIKDESWQFIKDVNNYFKNKIYFNNLQLNLALCSTNVSAIAVASGCVSVLLDIMLAGFKNKHTECVIQKNIITGFRHNLIDIYFKLSVAVSLLDYIWSWYKAYRNLRRRRYVKKSKIK